MFSKIRKFLGGSNSYKVEVENAKRGAEAYIGRKPTPSVLVLVMSKEWKLNPKRFKLSLVEGQKDYEVTDKITGDKYVVSGNTTIVDFEGYGSVFSTNYRIVCGGLVFTEDESNYLVKELSPYYLERGSRLNSIKDSRKCRQNLLAREVMQKKWENS